LIQQGWKNLNRVFDGLFAPGFHVQGALQRCTV